MALEILMPKLGLTMTEGTIEEWKFKEGDAVKKGDVLFSVATDKLTNDVEAEADGILLKILLPEGETASCKAVIGYIGQAGEVVPTAGENKIEAPEETRSDNIGIQAEKTDTRAPGAPVLASPAAKKLAKEKGIDLVSIPGTGPKGRITLEDVEAYLAKPQPAEGEAGQKTSPMAAKLAAELGVDQVYSELLPADKVTKVEELLEHKAPKEKLAFVGDGINDAPVLSRADIGIAMGAMGSDAAIEAADVVLMDDDPLKIAKAIRISRKCIRIVYQNIAFALLVKFACMALGAVGIANMWLAIFADVGVMVLAVLNAIRALFVHRL